MLHPLHRTDRSGVATESTAPVARSPVCVLRGNVTVPLLRPHLANYTIGDALLHASRRAAHQPTTTTLAYHAQFNGSLAAEYWQLANTHSRNRLNVSLFSSIVERRAETLWKPEFERDATLLIHLRLGDFMSQWNLTSARKELWCRAGTHDPPWHIPTASDSVTPLAKVKNRNCSDIAARDAVVQYLAAMGGYTGAPLPAQDVVRMCCTLRQLGSGWPGLRLMLVTGVHGRGEQYLSESCAYLDRLRRALQMHGFSVRVRSQGPDEDFILLATARFLLVSGGGFARLATRVALARGNALLRSEEQFRHGPLPQSGFFASLEDLTKRNAFRGECAKVPPLRMNSDEQHVPEDS